jgi:hypothetical protein
MDSGARGELTVAAQLGWWGRRWGEERHVEACGLEQKENNALMASEMRIYGH